MNIRLKIADLKIEYIYNFDTYFKGSLLPYKISSTDQVDYKMEVILSDEIVRPLEDPTLFKQNKAFFYSVDLDYITRYKEDIIVEQVVFNKKDHHVVISIHKDYHESLDLREYMLSSLMFLEIANLEGYLSLHASAISYQDQAILFCAPSKTGKSTQGAYWKMLFPEDVFFINDDKPLIYQNNQTFMITGSPFSGKSVLNENKERPLKAIVFLEQAEKNDMIKLKSSEALPLIFKNMMRPKDQVIWDMLLKIIEELVNRIPCYKLYATHSIDSAKLAYRTLFGG